MRSPPFDLLIVTVRCASRRSLAILTGVTPRVPPTELGGRGRGDG